MTSKVELLQKATEEAKVKMDEARAALDDSQRRVDSAKEALRQLDPEEQEKIKVTDTMLPELLDMHAQAKENFAVAEKRYETNNRYLSIYQAKR
eukprot:CAMPEP_0196813368 /NCGR_PEP_ID=MMETSP1362-20130617/36277_1 /TAXON_ID=163516 /ORGANISM="Leptocylindrus danicus, Strain CCMP1856" /LENGTH=93 /DNA_ID=CAMNT_0042189579 /DNA_START=21 /DNA_END=302 /DNA_ORIENTATION=+